MISSKILQMLSETELFQSVEKTYFSDVLNDENTHLVTYKNSEVIFSSDKYINSIGLIVKGSALVFKKGGDVLVSRLREKDVFGCQALFAGGECFPNVIVASGETTVFYIDKSAIVSFIGLDMNFAVDYIRYLSFRINFLNRRIENFTGGSAESRLAGYLLSCFGNYNSYIFDTSMVHLSTALDISRASLYRAFESLISCKIIEKKGKTVYLLDKEALISLI